MKLALQTGVHYTEQERLIKSLLRNKSVLSQHGIAVPGPGRYRKLVRDTLNAMFSKRPAENARAVLLDEMLEDAQAQRLILSDANFFRSAGTAVQKGALYPQAATRMKRFAQLFPEDELEIFMCIRNPATLVPILFNNAVDPSPDGFWGTRAPADMRWSELVHQIRSAVPHIPVTIWCAEDLPVIWETVMRALAAIDEDISLSGGQEMLEARMTPAGLAQYQTYLARFPGMTTSQKHRVTAAFLERFAREPEEGDAVPALSGWTPELVEDLTEIYDEDIFALQSLPGVTVIEP
ncbi:MAG: hypothetical protein AAF755_13550 [Pseudomonadota bacterium]